MALAGIAAAVLVLALECWRYWSSGIYLDHIEGNVVISGWQYVHGAPLYQIEAGSPRFATFYGPWAYLAPVPALLLFGATIATSKLASMLALFGTIAAMGAFFARPAEEGAWQGLLMLVAGLLLFSPASFWVRSDPIETLLVALAVIAQGSRSRACWVGICIGLAVNLKVHAFFYFLPVLVDLWWQERSRGLVAVGAVSILTFAVPFLVPGIVLRDYVHVLADQIGARPPLLSRLPGTLFILALLLMPIAVPLALQRQQRQTAIYAAAAMAVGVLLLYPATFPGAGAYHFLPLMPVLADARRRLRSKGVATDFLPLAILLFGCAAGSGVLHSLAATRGAAVVGAEALRLARESPVRPIEVGYGDSRQSYEASQLSRTLLALSSYPASFDAQVLMELREIGVDGSARWIGDLTRCRVRRWLLPKGEQPFALKNFFYDKGPLFDDRFRRAFFDSYRLKESTKHFDVWDCARPL